jgi:tetratricopeptide (TPR) repeat protein
MKTIQRLILAILSLSFIAGTLNAQRRAANPGAELWKMKLSLNPLWGAMPFSSATSPKYPTLKKKCSAPSSTSSKPAPRRYQTTATAGQTRQQRRFRFHPRQPELPGRQAARQAENSYKTAIKKYPNFRRAYKNLGSVQVQSGNFKDAIPTISKALELGEVDGRAYGLLAYGYLTEGMYYPAEAAYRQAILIQPKQKDWKIGLARCLLETERYKEAISLFDTLLQDEP